MSKLVNFPPGSYIYILHDQTRNNEPFYVGKGTRYRYNQHFRETEETTRNPYKFRRIRLIQEITSQNPNVEIYACNLTSDEAYEIEKQLIKKYGRYGYDDGGILTNVEEDGRPPCLVGDAHPNKGVHWSEDSNRKNSETHKRMYRENPNCHGMKGKHHPQETKDKISKTKTGTKLSEEHKRKISASQLGSKRTQETKDRMSKSAIQFAYFIKCPDGKQFGTCKINSFCKSHNLNQANLQRVCNHVIGYQQTKGYTGFKVPIELVKNLQLEQYFDPPLKESDFTLVNIVELVY
jgi:hypothetical protein